MSEDKSNSELGQEIGKPDINPLCVSIPTAAELLGVSRNTGYLMARMGQLPTIKCGKRRQVVPIAALKRLLENSAINNSGGGISG